MSTSAMFRRGNCRFIGIGVCLLVCMYLMYRMLSSAGLDVESDSVNLQRVAQAQHQGLLHGKAKSINMNAEKTREGIKLENGRFILNGQTIKIMSGAMHYFRVHPQYWKDRLMKMKACGLNTVETYVAWNLHEEIKGTFSFEGWLDLRHYVQLAAEAGLYVIIRPGPYICAEWEYGGLPSWLLRDPQMKPRTMYTPYLQAASRYLQKVISEVVDLQYSKGGPIIAWQVENEYGSFGEDHQYLNYLKDVMKKNGVIELTFISDGEGEDDRQNAYEKDFTPGLFSVVNFKEWKYGKAMFDFLKAKQPNLPLMVGEFWSGWFDHWGEKHHTDSIEKYEGNLKAIFENGAQGVNLYMFHGGTNFGFMNGANYDPKVQSYKPTITSYDYDALLTESGQPTDKWYKTRELMQKFFPEGVANGGPYYKRKIDLDLKPKSYGQVSIIKSMPFEDMLSHIKQAVAAEDPLPMEMLDMNNGGGQGYGFTLYRKSIPKGRHLKFIGSVKDRACVYLNKLPVSVFDWKEKDKTLNIETINIPLQAANNLDILVENLGRVNYFKFGDGSINEQRKGLVSDVQLDGKALKGWSIIPLEFRATFLQNLSSSALWKSLEMKENVPAVYLAKFEVKDEKPSDTFVDMTGWTKGVVFVNNFNIGRYWDIGPQKTMYIPGPLLHKGSNEIIIFELHKPSKMINLTDKSNLGPVNAP